MGWVLLLWAPCRNGKIKIIFKIGENCIMRNILFAFRGWGGGKHLALYLVLAPKGLKCLWFYYLFFLLAGSLSDLPKECLHSHFVHRHAEWGKRDKKISSETQWVTFPGFLHLCVCPARIVILANVARVNSAYSWLNNPSGPNDLNLNYWNLNYSKTLGGNISKSCLDFHSCFFFLNLVFLSLLTDNQEEWKVSKLKVDLLMEWNYSLLLFCWPCLRQISRLGLCFISGECHRRGDTTV